MSIKSNIPNQKKGCCIPKRGEDVSLDAHPPNVGENTDDSDVLDKPLNVAGDVNSKLDTASKIAEETASTGYNIAKGISKITGVAGKVIDVIDQGKQIAEAETHQDKVTQTAGATGFFTGALIGGGVGTAAAGGVAIGIIALSNPVGWVATGIFAVLTISGAAYGAYKGSSKGEELAEKSLNYWNGDDDLDPDPDQPNSDPTVPEAAPDGSNNQTGHIGEAEGGSKKHIRHL